MHVSRTRDVLTDIDALVGAIPGVRRPLLAPGARPSRCETRVAEEDQCLVVTVRIDVDDGVDPVELDRRVHFVISTFLAYLNHPLRPRIVVLVGGTG